MAKITASNINVQYCMLENFSRQHFEIFFLTFPRKHGLPFHEIFFLGNCDNKTINLSSAEYAYGVVEVNDMVH